jgi:uncharacterized membrane protein YagU involved in acid resistance
MLDAKNILLNTFKKKIVKIYFWKAAVYGILLKIAKHKIDRKQDEI